jgi:hypothetical protein
MFQYLILFVFLPSLAFARFQHKDAQKIDDETKSNFETYSDILSYDFSSYYNDLFEAHDFAFRALAGSLDSMRFYYKEQFKVQIEEKDQPISLRIRRDLVEDRVEFTESNEFQVGFHANNHGLGVLADGSSVKAHGDMGLAYLYNNHHNLAVEMYYWSVDHYFNDKKIVGSDRHKAPLWTAGTKVYADFFGLKVRLNYEYDSPVHWRHGEQGFDYTYGRSTYDALFKKELKSSGRLELRVHTDVKREGKDWYGHDQYKFLNRTHHLQELRWHRPYEDGSFDQYTLQRIERQARYRQSEELSFEYGTISKSRHELGSMYFHNRPFSQHHRYQLGLNWNAIELKEPHRRATASDIKLLMGLDLGISTKARALFYFTWDIDQLYADYPFMDGPARPWGGGALQIAAHF